jgi:acetyl esterase/lipase
MSVIALALFGGDPRLISETSMAHIAAAIEGSRMSWGTLSRAERDAAYNNSAAVAESPQYLARWTAASAAVRASRPQHLDLPYTAGERTKWDLFPASEAGAPCFVHVHGGYWQRNNREMFACLAAGVEAHGWSSAFAGYTLTPDASLTQIVAELRQALDWLDAHRRQRGIAGPLMLSGWSAGGHLAALLLGHPRIAAGCGISGVYELGPIRDTYLNEKVRLTDEEIATLSPLRLPQSAKPLKITYGTRELDALVGSSRDLHARRAAAHLPGDLVPATDHDHFSIMETLRSPTGLLTKCMLRLAEDV